ncbi:MAG: 4Fe-4S dicluster domain-containing protein [Coriobacteriia bacterium]|nr:4Fe-4S dicluster domain-containing protein [Coriobacteriia bacterium]MCL2749627.1 4Fe-4S dicluster domain-containing protein [Coriobacteriia bacterium]
MIIKIDGKECTCESGEFLIDIAKRNDIFVPTLCSMKPVLLDRGCCRVCVVELTENSRSKIVVSCIYPVERECEVFTQSEKAVRERGMVLALLKLLAPDAKLITQMAKAYHAPELERLEPRADGGSCILCGRCVDACNLLGTSAIAAMNRGVTKEINTAFGAPATTCIGCTSCAQVCPTDAISFEETDSTRTIWNQSFELAHCEICGEILGTAASLKHAANITGDEPSSLCPKHERRNSAKSLASIYRR